jgi:NAD-dependent deacetylase
MLASTKKITAFCGAGISTASGIPDFRSPGGLWQRFKPPDFQSFLRDESERERYWEFHRLTFGEMEAAQPNPAHQALAELEKQDRLIGVITQNVDGLHHRAGNSRLVELHGTVWFSRCLSCGREWKTRAILDRVEAGDKVPRCDSCEGLIKPATISFGQSLSEEAIDTAARWTGQAEVFLALGSSLTVYPAAGFPAMAAQHGAKLVIINAEATPLDSLAELVINDRVDEVLPRVI